MMQATDGGIVVEGRAEAGAGLGEAAGEGVDIARVVRGGEEAAVEIPRQRRFQRAHLRGRDAHALEPALGEQGVDAGGAVEAVFVAIDVEDAARLAVEIDAFGLGHLVQDAAGGDGHAHGIDRIAVVVRDLRHELHHPGILMPGGFGVHEERGILLGHPFDAFEDGGPAGPDLGIAGGELAAIGEGGLHACIAVPVEDRDGIAALEERIGGGDAGDTGADHGDMLHDPRSDKATG